MPGSQIRQEVMEVTISNLKGKAMSNKLNQVENNPEDEKGGLEPISHLTKGSY